MVLIIYFYVIFFFNNILFYIVNGILNCSFRFNYTFKNYNHFLSCLTFTSGSLGYINDIKPPVVVR